MVLDRESQSQYLVPVVATSKAGQSATLSLTVTVADLEDSQIQSGGRKKFELLLVQGTLPAARRPPPHLIAFSSVLFQSQS